MISKYIFVTSCRQRAADQISFFRFVAINRIESHKPGLFRFSQKKVTLFRILFRRLHGRYNLFPFRRRSYVSLPVLSNCTGHNVYQSSIVRSSGCICSQAGFIQRGKF